MRDIRERQQVEHYENLRIVYRIFVDASILHFGEIKAGPLRGEIEVWIHITVTHSVCFVLFAPKNTKMKVQKLRLFQSCKSKCRYCGRRLYSVL